MKAAPCEVETAIEQCRKHNAWTLSRVVDTRAAPGGYVRRRRVCLTCGGRFTTYEGTVAPPAKEARDAIAAFIAETEKAQERGRILLAQLRDAVNEPREIEAYEAIANR